MLRFPICVAQNEEFTCLARFGELDKVKELSAEDLDTLADEPELYRCRPFNAKGCGVGTNWS